MKSLHRKRLNNLLLASAAQSKDELLKICHKAATAYGLLDYRVTRQILKQDIINIYAVRSRDKHSPAKGFSSFLEGLNSVKDAQIRLHSFTANNEHFLIATDTATKRVIGLLAVDVTGRRGAKWYPENSRLFG